jgi:fucose permease
LVVVFAIVALEFSLSFWLASYLHDSVGLARNLAVAMVAGLYAANLAGRLAASRLAHTMTTAALLAVAIGVGLIGLPILLVATNAAVAAVGLAVVGAGIGATFPLTSSLHVAASSRPADTAVGEVLVVAAIGQIVGPLAVAGIAEGAGLRVGLLVLPALAALAALALARHHATVRSRPAA